MESALGQRADSKYRRGDPLRLRSGALLKVHDRDGWIYTVPLAEEAALDQHVQKLVAAFDGREDELANLAAEAQAEIYLSLASNSDLRRVELSPEALAGLSRLGLSVVLGVFAWDRDG